MGDELNKKDKDENRLENITSRLRQRIMNKGTTDENKIDIIEKGNSRVINKNKRKTKTKSNLKMDENEEKQENENTNERPKKIKVRDVEASDIIVQINNGLKLKETKEKVKILKGKYQKVSRAISQTWR